MPPPSRFRGQLNPAFGAAHGLADDAGAGAGRPGPRRPARGGGRTAPAAPSRAAKTQAALRAARRTGRLQLCDCGLTALPDGAFDLRAGIEIDLSLDAASNPGRSASRGEEEVTSVDASDNPLASLDARVERFRSVPLFRARRAGLTRAPWASLATLDCLAVLDLSGNRLAGRAAVERLPTTLRELNLSGNELTGLTTHGDGGAFVLPFLTALDVSHNRLEALPPGLDAPLLHTLNFSDNRVAALPADLLARCARALATLDGRGNRLDRAPDLRACRSLRVVDLGRNALAAAPAVAPTLVCLSLEGNRLADLAGLFGGAQAGDAAFRSSLAELRLSSNRLTSLDADVARCLAAVVLLDVAMNDLPDLPRCVGYLPLLRRAVLDGNPCLRRIRNPLLNDTGALKAFLRKRGGPPPGGGYLEESGVGGAGGGGTGAAGDVPGPRSTNSKWRSIVGDALVGTCKLDLRNHRLDSLPEELRAELSQADTSAAGSSGRGHANGEEDVASASNTFGKRIRRLDLSNNAFASLDDGWFEAMPGLATLDAGKNRLEALPDALAAVPLAEVALPRNALTAEAVARGVLRRPATPLFASLTALDLSGNRLAWFPGALCDLPHLARLVLAGNGLTTLAVADAPAAAGGGRRGWGAEGGRPPPSLELLDLSSNKLGDLGGLPASLAAGGATGALRVLLLHNNELRALPPELGRATSLTTLDLRGNPQRGIRPALLEQGCEEVLAYLRGRLAPATAAAAAPAAVDGAATTGARGAASTGTRPGAGTADSVGGVAPGKVEGSRAAATSSTGGANDDGDDDEEQRLAERVAELTRAVDDCRTKLNKSNLSGAMKYRLKKEMALKNSELIREGRKLKHLRSSKSV